MLPSFTFLATLESRHNVGFIFLVVLSNAACSYSNYFPSPLIPQRTAGISRQKNLGCLSHDLAWTVSLF